MSKLDIDSALMFVFYNDEWAKKLAIGDVFSNIAKKLATFSGKEPLNNGYASDS